MFSVTEAVICLGRGCNRGQVVEGLEIILRMPPQACNKMVFAWGLRRRGLVCALQCSSRGMLLLPLPIMLNAKSANMQLHRYRRYLMHCAFACLSVSWQPEYQRSRGKLEISLASGALKVSAGADALPRYGECQDPQPG